ncbi:SIS domain-containing protein [Mycolicibacterium sp. CH28]|uniref:SIS domain-containing protein n=1 Tax=Mycolicibacterium sp. CH28 TaxID=2512237 RepID=UPI0010812B9C|nr:SIS domain-containing protein [Mycolicibacterium sp. CH28]TGD86692.1 SIS domain-containing protein [Mycolicibacterium sp. CH28]
MTVTDIEIASQPELWRRTATADVPEFISAPGQRMLVIGCGTSAFVAMAYAQLREAAGFGETDWAYASEVPTRRRYDTVLAITRSGTTTEVITALNDLDAGTKVVVTAVPNGPLAPLVDHELVLEYADESSVVQTRFPTTVLVMLRKALGQDLAPVLADGERATGEPLPVDAASYRHYVYLGSGWTVGLAYEAALKMREAAQAWSESYPAMDYRHGPIAVAGPESLVWLLGPPPDGLVEQIAQTGATVVTGDLDPLAQLVQAQRCAVAAATAKGLDPDQPRGLTRSVVLA